MMSTHPTTSMNPVAGLQQGAPRPVEIKLHQKSRVLEVAFDDGRSFRLPCELLRVYSPSAEVRGHGPGQETLQVGKEDVEITGIEPVGHYAVKLVFSDGHDTGLYSWDHLYDLGMHQDAMWQQYLDRLHKAGIKREPAAPPAPASPKNTWKKI
jgi:DUF971 family protein